MTRKQAQAAQIERARKILLETHGQEVVAAIEADVNRCIAAGDQSRASIEWLYSKRHRDIQAYDYGRMVIDRHFQEGEK